MDSILHTFQMLWYGVEGRHPGERNHGQDGLGVEALGPVQLFKRAYEPSRAARCRTGVSATPQTNVQSASALLRSSQYVLFDICR